MPKELTDIVRDFSYGLKSADSKRPQAINQRSKAPYRPGIGPHTEAQTVQLVLTELADLHPRCYGQYALGVPYPDMSRQKCDLCLGIDPDWEWAIEVKKLRMLGDNGKVNDNILMHILSPYPTHRSAVTDCSKLVASGLHGRKAIIIYGYEHDEWPLDPAIEAFELLAQTRAALGQRSVAEFSGLVHPIHSQGKVFGWELTVR